MPPKKGTKRKAAKDSPSTNGDADPTPPNRSTWPGWVEMESEPAFFNVMLKEMGVRGVKTQEIHSLDEEQMVLVPQPIHALIFLFRYKDTEAEQEEIECPNDVWFANQIPDFACASVALLNIVNNIKGLQMGKEMGDFKDFTKDLNPMARGDAIDGFDFLRRLHNSFARETEMLTADLHTRDKANKIKRRKAAIQAKATKEAKKAADPSDEKTRTDSVVATPTRASKRNHKATAKAKTSKPETLDSGTSTSLSEPPDSDPEFRGSKKPNKNLSPTPEKATRRSGRQPKPRKNPTELFSEAEANADQEGFHYVAYLPVNGRVWKLDGMDSYPHLVGEFDGGTGGEWMNVAIPELQARMMMFEGGAIEFNLMAVCRDPVVRHREELAENVKELQMIDRKLDEVSENWRDNANAASEDVLFGPCQKLDLANADLDAAQPSSNLEVELLQQKESYIEGLLRLRRERIKMQAPLRAAVRALLLIAEDDDKKAEMRRHDFGTFVKGWLGALAEQESLKDLVDDQLG